ncbi:MAG TPA: hypothetical protein VNO23_03380 [Candidatus Binatia bacterium]|nr:hypothetical protein [Candidatus Binatia bacterium]
MDQRYWEASRRVRETFARHALADLLRWAHDLADEILAAPDDELEDFLFSLRERVGAIEPAWAPAMDALREAPGASLRRELAEAFVKIRALAHGVATRQASPPTPVTVELSISHPAEDRDGRPRWIVRGRLADALVWTTLKLFAEVPRSLIRPCGMTTCPRVYVGAKNQRYCPSHQREARRQAQRRAERAFRARQRATKRGKKWTAAATVSSNATAGGGSTTATPRGGGADRRRRPATKSRS